MNGFIAIGRAVVGRNACLDTRGASAPFVGFRLAGDVERTRSSMLFQSNERSSDKRKVTVLDGSWLFPVVPHLHHRPVQTECRGIASRIDDASAKSGVAVA